MTVDELTIKVDELMAYWKGSPPEACADLNDLQRDLIDAMNEEHSDAWLGRINLYSGADQTIMWKWDGGMVYNFGAAFVLPVYDAELEQLVQARQDAPYTGMKVDRAWIVQIQNRIEAVGGVHLVWS